MANLLCAQQAGTVDGLLTQFTAVTSSQLKAARSFVLFLSGGELALQALP